MLFCTDCGSLFEEQQDICPECGFNLQEQKELNDKTVDRMLRSFRRQVNEIDRLIAIRKSRIEDEKKAIEILEAKKDKTESYLATSLEGFMERMIDQKLTNRTKTQQTYKLVEGSISLTNPVAKVELDKQVEMDLNDAKLKDYKKIEEKLDWATLKKELVVEDGKLLKDGKPFIIKGINVVEYPSAIKIKLGKEE